MRWFAPILLSVGMLIVMLASLPVAKVPRARETARRAEPPPPVGWRHTRTGWIYFEPPLLQAAGPPAPPPPFAFHPALFALLQILLSVGALTIFSSPSTAGE